MDFLQIIIGRYLLELLGALIRYIYLNIKELFTDNNYAPFFEIWIPKGSRNKKDENSSLNHMIGVIFFITIIILLAIFMI